jgi:hypothetical protein
LPFTSPFNYFLGGLDLQLTSALLEAAYLPKQTVPADALLRSFRPLYSFLPYPFELFSTGRNSSSLLLPFLEHTSSSQLVEQLSCCCFDAVLNYSVFADVVRGIRLQKPEVIECDRAWAVQGTKKALSF